MNPTGSPYHDPEMPVSIAHRILADRVVAILYSFPAARSSDYHIFLVVLLSQASKYPRSINASKIWARMESIGH